MEPGLEKGPDFAPVWVPPCDVFETENSIVVVMEIVGVALDDVEVLVKEKIITLWKSTSDLFIARLSCGKALALKLFRLFIARDFSL